MKKRAITIFVAVILTIAGIQVCAYAADAVKTESSIYLNDSRVSIDGYNINGNNYFKLRDLAYALRDTTSCFDVEWNAESDQVELMTQKAYSGYADEIRWWISPVYAAETTSALLIDGQKIDITAYNINDYNYYKLRDLGEFIPLGIYWDEAEDSIYLYTGLDNGCVLTDGNGKMSRLMSTSKSTDRWSTVIRSYMCDNEDGTFSVIDAENDKIYVDTYDTETDELLTTYEIPYELELFGGFYSGEKYNFIVYGQNNNEEDDNKVTFKTVKYSKDWEKIGAADYKGNNTIHPFDAGTLRMAENNGYLYVRTCHEMYTSSDGLNHQSNMAYQVDIESMKIITNSMSYVSHSFNQFIKINENGDIILVDHGDAYPRSIVMTVLSDENYETQKLFEIPGPIGANCTGVTVGGLEFSQDSYLVAINTIDHTKASGYDSFNIFGLDKDERDIVLLVSKRDNNQTQKAKQIYLTDYPDNNKLGSTPYLVKLDDDRFMVLWEEFNYEPSKDNGVKYVEVDGNGEVISSVQSLPDMRLSSDCQPIVINDEVVWYINKKAGRMFYKIPID